LIEYGSATASGAAVLIWAGAFCVHFLMIPLLMPVSRLTGRIIFAACYGITAYGNHVLFSTRKEHRPVTIPGADTGYCRIKEQPYIHGGSLFFSYQLDG
jgi:hypothetical protein